MASTWQVVLGIMKPSTFPPTTSRLIHIYLWEKCTYYIQILGGRSVIAKRNPLTMFLLMLLSISLTAGYQPNKTCYRDRIVDEPLVHQEGDYILAAIFSMGQYTVEKRADETGTLREVEYCSYSNPDIYRVQKAIVFRRTMMAEMDRLRLI